MLTIYCSRCLGARYSDGRGPGCSWTRKQGLEPKKGKYKEKRKSVGKGAVQPKKKKKKHLPDNLSLTPRKKTNYHELS